MMSRQSTRTTRARSAGRRRALAAVVVAAAAGTTLAACQLPGASFVVTTTIDGVDAAPGDGVCETVTGNGVCTVRAAVMEANAVPGTNNIELGDGNTYLLTMAGGNEHAALAGDLDITESVAVNGRSTIDATGSSDRVFEVRAGALILDGPTVTGGTASSPLTGGGIRIEAGASLLAIDATIAGNFAVLGGGGIDSSGTVDLVDATVRDNSVMGYTSIDEPYVPAPGAGISMHSATLTVRTSSISGNQVTDVGPGGGIAGDGTAQVVLERSTVSGNRSTSSDGAAIAAPTVTIRSSTIADNAGGVTVAAATLSSTSSTVTSLADPLIRATAATVGGTILATNGQACLTPVASTGYNVASDATCGLSGTGDRSSTGAVLAPLAANGGPTATRLPFAGSPVLDAIPTGTASLCDSSTTVDQRGVTRPSGGRCDIGAVEGASTMPAAPLALVVGDAGDAPDTNAGDASCATATGTCTLRAAITEANAWPAADVVTIAPGVNPAPTDAPPLPAITDSLAIHGSGATISGPPGTYSELAPILTVQFGTVTIDHAHLRGQGGLLLLGGSVQVQDSSVSGARQAGIDVRRPAQLTLVRSTVSGNRFGVSASNTPVTIVQSTIGPNRAEALQAGQYTAGVGPVQVAASTLSGPADGTTGAIRTGGSSPDPVRLRGSIVATRLGAAACTGAVRSDGFNVIGDSTCGAIAPGDRIGVDPLLLPLAENGGPTRTRLPYAGNPAIGAIPSGTAGLCDGSLATDQRGSPRPVGGACDAGAVEGESTVSVGGPLNLVVTSGADANDAAPGDGVCLSTGGGCTLRAAIDESNAWPRADVVAVAAGVNPTLAIAGAGEDDNATGDLDIVDPVTINGAGATLDARGLDRAIDLRSGVTTINGLAVRGAARFDTSRSGAIVNRSTSGGLTIIGSSITANATDGIWSEGTLSVRTSSITGNTGSGIASTGLGPATVDRSTISGNGGGISSFGPLTVRRSTITDNHASAIAQMSYWEDITIIASTIESTSPYGTIVTMPSGGSWVKVTGSAITGTGGPACNGTIQSGGFNRVTDATCGLAASGDLQVSSLGIGALANNGGPTRTRLPNVGSPLLDVIPAGTPGLCDATLPVDQRNQARPQGAGCDVGAVERTP